MRWGPRGASPDGVQFSVAWKRGRNCPLAFAQGLPLGAGPWEEACPRPAMGVHRAAAATGQSTRRHCGSESSSPSSSCSLKQKPAAG